MNQYYYTVASLPGLKLEEPPFLSRAEFLAVCEIELSAEDLRYVSEAAILLEERADDTDETTHYGVLGAWNKTVREFQRQAALLRAQALGWEADRLPRPDVTDPSIPERLRQILNEDNPLKIENALLRWLWQTADSLETGHHFDREKLVVYHLKLQIAARRARINDSEAGGEAFDHQYNEVAQSLMEIAT